MKLSPSHASPLPSQLCSSALFMIQPLAPQASSPGWPIKSIINGQHLITLSSRMPKFITHLCYELLFHLESVQSDAGMGTAILATSWGPAQYRHSTGIAEQAGHWVEITHKVKQGCPQVMAKNPWLGCRWHVPRCLLMRACQATSSTALTMGMSS